MERPRANDGSTTKACGSHASIRAHQIRFSTCTPIPHKSLKLHWRQTPTMDRTRSLAFNDQLADQRLGRIPSDSFAYENIYH